MSKHNDTSQFLESANAKYETAFQNATRLAQEMNSIDESTLAAKRALSYNPTNRCVMELFPEYQDVIQLICDLISKHSSIVKDSSNFQSWNILGHCYLLLGDFPNAFAAFTHANQIPNISKDSYFWFSMGVVYSHFKYNENAAECFQHVLQDKKAKKQKEFFAELRFRLAILYRSLKRYKESIAFFIKMYEKPPRNLSKDDIRFQIAYTYQLSSDIYKAGVFYKEIYQNHPNSLKALEQYAWFSAIVAHETQLAIQLLQRSLDENPDEPTVLLLLARIMMKENQTNTAYAYYRNCIGYWRDVAPFWCSLGVLYFKNEQMQDAVIAFQRALYLSCDMLEAWLNLGTILEKLNQHENALKIYTTGKLNCSNTAPLDQRLQNMGRKSGQNDYDIIDINDDDYFVQIPLEFANSYIAAVPKIPPACLGITDVNWNLDQLSSYPKSLFPDT